MHKLLIITQVVDRQDPILGFFHAWIAAFTHEWDQVTVVCARVGEHDLPRNVRVLSLGKEAGASKNKQLFRFCLYLWRERKRYDRVFVHMTPEYAVLGGPVWRLLKKPVSLWYTHKSVTGWLRRAVTSVSTVFTASKESFQLAAPNVSVVGHGIDVDTFAFMRAVQHERDSIVVVGRVAPIKRQHEAVQILHTLHTKGRRAKLSIVGVPAREADHAYESVVRTSAEELGCVDAVLWKGAVRHDALPGMLQSHRVMLHLSETGSLDKVVLEALSCGALVVTTSKAVQAVLPERLRDLQPKNDTTESVADALLHVLQLTDAQYDTYAREGRGWIEREHALRALITRMSTQMIDVHLKDR